LVVSSDEAGSRHRPSIRHRDPPLEGDAGGHGRGARGDDQFGEDPTVNLLQERVAALLGVA
jgi:hypothetical protein